MGAAAWRPSAAEGMLAPMHIPDGFLSPGVAAVSWGLSASAMVASLRSERRERVRVSSGVLGAVGAFLFAAQMVNVPVAPGTSGHLVGATLAAALVGPWRAIVVMSIVLAVQAVLFQDGGLAAFGANLFDMGVAGAITGYGTAVAVTRVVGGQRGQAAGIVMGAFAATLAAAACTAVWLAASGLYPLGGILPALLVTHVVIGLLEAALTGGIVITLLRWRPDLLGGFSRTAGGHNPVASALGLLGAALAVAAFLAPFASSLPDGLERTLASLGLDDRARPIGAAPFPDYAVPWQMPAAAAAAVAGLAGTGLVALVAWLLSRRLASRHHDLHQ